MSPKRSQRMTVPRSKSGDYKGVADNFYSGAEMARAYDYWNAAGLLIVHAAIAYTDAVTIKVGGIKSRGEDHMAAADLLEEVVILDEKGKNAVKHLARIIEQKNIISYSGEIYRRSDIDKLWKHLQRYKTWAFSMLGR